MPRVDKSLWIRSQLSLVCTYRLLEDQQRGHQEMQEESRRVHEEQLHELDREIITLQNTVTNAEVTEKEKNDRIRSLEKKLEWTTQ